MKYSIIKIQNNQPDLINTICFNEERKQPNEIYIFHEPQINKFNQPIHSVEKITIDFKQYETIQQISDLSTIKTFNELIQQITEEYQNETNKIIKYENLPSIQTNQMHLTNNDKSKQNKNNNHIFFLFEGTLLSCSIEKGKL